MGTSPNTVKSQLRTGLARLRESLDTSVAPATHVEPING
jgi:DNA-directed RNA polymerase specialized sigma24 family protein